ncbi:MAG: SIS domain-containing protein [Anaerolineaceae bacterium]|nr:SIS domain-containing protein [Anaerolineaceae bacterium]
MNNEYTMLEYIYDDGPSLQRTLEENESGIIKTLNLIQSEGIENIVVSGIGSSYTAAVMAAPILRYHSTLPVHIIPTTELSYYAGKLINEKTLIIAISRSGERDWVIKGLQTAMRSGAKGIAMTGVADSSLAQAADSLWFTREGPEKSFPKTKSVIACSGLLMRFALALAGSNDQLAIDRLIALNNMPTMITDVVTKLNDEVKALIPFIKKHKISLITGTGSNYGAALEATVKIQETSLITSLSDDTGNLLHGPTGAINSDWLLMPLVHSSDEQLNIELLKLVGKLGGDTLCITEPGLNVESLATEVLELPNRVDLMLAALAYLPPIQLINYYWTIALGLNPDQPDAMYKILESILPPGRNEPNLEDGR